MRASPGDIWRPHRVPCALLSEPLGLATASGGAREARGHKRLGVLVARGAPAATNAKLTAHPRQLAQLIAPALYGAQVSASSPVWPCASRVLTPPTIRVAVFFALLPAVVAASLLQHPRTRRLDGAQCLAASAARGPSFRRAWSRRPAKTGGRGDGTDAVRYATSDTGRGSRFNQHSRFAVTPPQGGWMITLLLLFARRRAAACRCVRGGWCM